MENPVPVYYNDGCIRYADFVYIASKLKHLHADEYDFARMTFYKKPQWAIHDLDWNVTSVCAARDGSALYALSDRGDVHTSVPGQYLKEKISDVESLGAVKQIREIGGPLHVCGDQGQVYRRQSDGSWMHIDAGILDRENHARIQNRRTRGPHRGQARLL